MARFIITEQGVFNQDGEEAPVGTVLEVEEDEDGNSEVPGWLSNKCRRMDEVEADEEEAEAVTNPATGGRRSRAKTEE